MSFNISLYKNSNSVKKLLNNQPLVYKEDYIFHSVEFSRILDVIEGRLGIVRRKIIKLNELQKSQLLEILNTCGYWSDAELILWMCKNFNYQYISIG